MRFENRNRYLEEICRLARKKTNLAMNRDRPEDPEHLLLAQEIQRQEEELFAAGETALQGDLFLPLQYLLDMTDCSPFERHCVLMGLAYELGYPSQPDCARINGSETQPGLTPKFLAWAWQGAPEPEMICEAFGESSLLMQVFFERAGAASPFSEQVICLKTRIRDFLLGNLFLSGDLAQVIGSCFPNEELPPLGAGQPDVADLLDQDTDVVELWGAAGSGRCFSARTACMKMNKRCFPVHPEEAFVRGWTPDRMAEQILLESLLFQALPILRIPKRWESEKQELWLGTVIRLLSGRVRPVFLASFRKLGIGNPGEKLCVQSFELESMSTAEARGVWKEEAKSYVFAAGLH